MTNDTRAADSDESTVVTAGTGEPNGTTGTSDAPAGVTDTKSANGTGQGGADTEPVCSVCGIPLHILRSGPTGEVRDDGVVWLTVLGCQNKSDHGGLTPCVLFGQDQKRVENVVPTVS